MSWEKTSWIYYIYINGLQKIMHFQILGPWYNYKNDGLACACPTHTIKYSYTKSYVIFSCMITWDSRVKYSYAKSYVIFSCIITWDSRVTRNVINNLEIFYFIFFSFDNFAKVLFSTITHHYCLLVLSLNKGSLMIMITHTLENI